MHMRTFGLLGQALADSHFKFFAAFAKGLLGGVTSAGAAAFGTAAPAP